MSYDYDTEPTFASRYLPALDEPTAREEKLMEFNTRLSRSLAEALALVQEKNARIAALEQAGRDVLPTFTRMGPLPEWHPVAELRRVLEEGK